MSPVVLPFSTDSSMKTSSHCELKSKQRDHTTCCPAVRDTRVPTVSLVALVSCGTGRGALQ